MVHACPKCNHEIPDDAPRGLCPHCLFATAADREASAGETIGYRLGRRYEAIQEISRGGMGRILLAHDERIGRNVALKELLPELLPPASSAQRVQSNGSPSMGGLSGRFAHEAQLTGQLEHPYIVPVYEISPQGETPYYTMRHVRGRTLAACLDGCTSLDQRMALLSNYLHACQAIAYAHSKEIIHRDIKPANILVGEFGETVVIDWGLAKSLRSADQRDDVRFPERPSPVRDFEATRPGQQVGSPFYMSPEQVLSEADTVDTRTDVYTLGVVLYQILTGRKPFDGSDLGSIFQQIRDEHPAPPRRIEKRVPRELETICLRALEKDPADRYPSALELANDIERFLAGALVEAYSYTALERLGRFYRTHRTSIRLALVFVVLLGATVGVSFRSIENARDEALGARDQEQAAREVAERERYFALVNLGRHQIESNEVDAARQTLLAIDANQRQWEWRYLFNSASQGEPRLQGFSHIRLVGDGSMLAGVGPHAPLTGWRMGDLQQQFVLAGDMAPVSTFEVSNAESILYSGHTDGTLRIWDTARWSPLASVKVGDGVVVRLALPRSGGRVVAITSLGELAVVDIVNRDMVPVLRTQIYEGAAMRIAQSGLGSADVSLSASRDGTRVVAGARDWGAKGGHVRLWRLDEGTDKVLSDSGTRPRVFPDGDRVLYLNHGRIEVRDFAVSGPAPLSVGPLAEEVVEADFTPDGQWLGALTESGHVYMWPVADVLGQAQLLAAPNVLEPEQRLIGFGDRYFAVLTMGGPFRVLEPSRPDTQLEFRGHSGPVSRIVLDSDRNQLITTGNDGFVRFWKLDAAQPTATVHSFPSWGNDLDYEPQGNLVVAAGTGAPIVAIDAQTDASDEVLPPAGAQSGDAVALSRDGRQVATTPTSNTVEVFNLAGRRLVARLEGHTNTVSAIEFSSDSEWLLTASLDGTVRIWDWAGNREVGRLAHGSAEVLVAHWVEGDQRIVTATRWGELAVWNSETSERLLTTKAHGAAIFAVQPVGHAGELVTGDFDGVIRRWDARTLEARGELSPGGSRVRSLALSPDGTRLLSGHSDGKIKIWDAGTWREVTALRGHSGSVRDLVFTRDGAKLFSVGDDGRVRVWQASANAWDGEQTTQSTKKE